MTFYCSRTLALDFIFSKLTKSYEYKDNYHLSFILEYVVNNKDYQFIVIGDEDIDYMPKTHSMITEYSLNHIYQPCQLK